MQQEQNFQSPGGLDRTSHEREDCFLGYVHAGNAWFAYLGFASGSARSRLRPSRHVAEAILSCPQESNAAQDPATVPARGITCQLAIETDTAYGPLWRLRQMRRPRNESRGYGVYRRFA